MAEPDYSNPDDDGDDNGQQQQPPADGHLSYQEWVDAGNDPELYQGKKAFELNQKEITEKRKYRKDLQNMQNTLQQTVEGVDALVADRLEEQKAHYEQQLHDAMAAEDPKAAVEAQKGLDRVEQQQQQQQNNPPAQEYSEPDVLVDWRGKHPIVNADSDQFNPEFNEAMVGYFNSEFAQLTMGGRKALSDTQMERLATKAYNQAKGLYPELFESQRNSRQQQQQQRTTRRQQQQQQDESVQTAENYHIEQKNPNQKQDPTTAASDIKEQVQKTALENALRIGRTREQAQAIAEQAGADFEKNLYR